MSFLFNWTDLQRIDIKSIINKALSQFDIPQFPNKLQLKSIFIDSTPPVLKINKIEQFSLDKLQLQIEFKYSGELELNLNSKLEINAINLIDFDSFTKPHFVMSNKSTVIPIDFQLSKFQIDSNMTFIFIKRVNKLILVFNQDPIIEFNLKSSIDELLDDDVLAEIRDDTLQMCLRFVKNELPLIINGYSVLEGMGAVQDIEIEDNTKEYEAIMTNNRNMHGYFNTLALNTPGLKDVYQRVTLEAELQNSEISDISFHSSPKKRLQKRRVIKMKKSGRSNKSSPERSTPFSQWSSPVSSVSSPPPLHESTLDSPTLNSTSIDLKGLNSNASLSNDNMKSFHTADHHSSTFNNFPTTPTLNNSGNMFNDCDQSINSSQADVNSFNLKRHNSILENINNNHYEHGFYAANNSNSLHVPEKPSPDRFESNLTHDHILDADIVNGTAAEEEHAVDSANSSIDSDKTVLASPSSDPYEDLVHPLDILPSFEDLTASLNEGLLKNEEMKKSGPNSSNSSAVFEYDDHDFNDDGVIVGTEKMSERRTSSNYINLNEFRKRGLKELKELAGRNSGKK